MSNRICRTGPAHAPTKANAPDQNCIEGDHTQRHSIKSVIVMLIHWADPIGWALLVIAALYFAGRVWA